MISFYKFYYSASQIIGSHHVRKDGKGERNNYLKYYALWSHYILISLRSDTSSSIIKLFQVHMEKFYADVKWLV